MFIIFWKEEPIDLKNLGDNSLSCAFGFVMLDTAAAFSMNSCATSSDGGLIGVGERAGSGVRALAIFICAVKS